MEEAKNQESAKLKSVVEELQAQSQQTKELMQKEREAAKKEIEQARSEKDASSMEIVDKLTAENDKLKVKFIKSNIFSCLLCSVVVYFFPSFEALKVII